MISSVRLGLPATLMRSTTVLTNSPTISSKAASVRPATGMPTAISVLPLRRANNATTPAVITMKLVARCSRANRATLWRKATGQSTATPAPSCRATCG
ncbi:hypothetical protein LAUMK22_02908 [Mycobacterium kansasii]|nr:hypothetical protein LAUMK22_02908 [Mycobacterium kansasii]VAZ67407.1 hypothetical protein LAUMK40_03546 [Mycobacterium kansasii]